MEQPRIGTAGWSIHSRHAAEFPGEGSHLARYAARLNAAEINSSFYRPHRQDTYRRWADAVPEDFRFAVKAPKTITHERRLVDCADLLAGFAAEIAGLGAKLGVVLVQLPPSLSFGPTIAATFFRLLAGTIDAPVACEPRHASWFSEDAGALLSKNCIARVAADPPTTEGGGEPGGWSGLAYYRWHGSPAIYRSSYDAPALEALARRLRRSARSGATPWCIFDNTTLSHALENAVSITKLSQVNISK